jgi:hypothetical protein
MPVGSPAYLYLPFTFAPARRATLAGPPCGFGALHLWRRLPEPVPAAALVADAPLGQKCHCAENYRECP